MRLSPFALIALATTLAAQAPLTTQRIFASREFAAQPAPQTRWLDDSTFTALEPSASGKGQDLIRISAATGAKSTLVTAAQLTPSAGASPLEVEDYFWSPDHSKLLISTNTARVWRTNTRGDFWVLDLTSHHLLQLGGTAALERPSTMQFATFSPDGKRVGYVWEHNLYVENIDDARITPLTSDGSVTTINGTFDWVYEEELSLQDGFVWSPDGTHIAYWQLDATGVRDFLLINNTDSLYSFVKPIQYPKAGTTNSAARIGIVSASGGATTWLQVPGDPRNSYLARMDWAANSSELAVQQLNRRQNVNTLWFASAATGAVRSVIVEKDSAWIDIWSPAKDPLTWFNNGKSFVWLSERDGWQHAYTVGRDGAMKLITKGAYDVTGIEYIDTAGGWLYFKASPSNATQLYLWRTRLDGTGDAQRLTPAAEHGVHSYDIGPGAKWAIDTWSSWGVPPKVDLVQLPSHKTARVLVSNDALAAKLAGVVKGPQEFFQVDIGGGVKLDAWMMKPPGFDPAKKYPILFFIYGEPASQTVTDDYGRARYLWHLMITQHGYIVASVDNRGSPAPKGRAWRKAVLDQIGGLRVREQSAAARIIGRMPGVDSTRIGVWGWSGGGSSTLLLMFRAPEIYKVGMAVAPVPDVHDYDTIYEERYVGLPGPDSAAYYDASAVNFVSGLKGDLLVVHGSGDDNVHYQGTEQLINALVAAGKPFQMMEYPNRTHGIFEGAGTTLHLFNLLTSYLEQHLPAGAK